jgi:hypothetical protein
MTQRLITIAINYEEADEQSVALALASLHGGSATAIEDAVTIIAQKWQSIETATVPHWSCSTQQNWMTQQEEITRLYRAMEDHVCSCCHQSTEPPPGATTFVRGTCPPGHNCAVCADTIA